MRMRAAGALSGPKFDAVVSQHDERIAFGKLLWPDRVNCRVSLADESRSWRRERDDTRKPAGSNSWGPCRLTVGQVPTLYTAVSVLRWRIIASPAGEFSAANRSALDIDLFSRRIAAIP